MSKTGFNIELNEYYYQMVKRIGRRHKMSDAEVVTYVIKVKYRRDNPGLDLTLEENEIWRFTTKEARAARRG